MVTSVPAALAALKAMLQAASLKWKDTVLAWPQAVLAILHIIRGIIREKFCKLGDPTWPSSRLHSLCPQGLCPCPSSDWRRLVLYV